MTGKSYLTVEDVARHFGVTSTTVYRLAQRGMLPGFKVGNQWRFSVDMLESWVADQVTVERLKAEDRLPSAKSPRGFPSGGDHVEHPDR